MDEREREYTDAWETEHFHGSSDDIERMQTEQDARGYRISDLVQITGKNGDEQEPPGLRLNGRTGYVSEIDDNPEYPIGLTVEGWLGPVWCNSSEIRHLSAEEIARLESGVNR